MNLDSLYTYKYVELNNTLTKNTTRHKNGGTSRSGTYYCAVFEEQDRNKFLILRD